MSRNSDEVSSLDVAFDKVTQACGQISALNKKSSGLCTIPTSLIDSAMSGEVTEEIDTPCICRITRGRLAFAHQDGMKTAIALIRFIYKTSSTCYMTSKDDCKLYNTNTDHACNL
ncbi:hypothetical protein LOTGIDRAFT_176990 [Lottia gigantea]|uniref:Uncharacterized protein n=1 Tax=Lottia gigantea TaxID=225164 RepID=V3YVB9_LOTGI|nr:hypothetical protein LOTGIDRAFT_176990 [Lottia gigantea]ESO81893.1 hypothetical protein LOTGIDRAFT_176990 [Lottia gigantea]